MVFQEEVKTLSNISMMLLRKLEPEPVYVREYIEKECEKIQKGGVVKTRRKKTLGKRRDKCSNQTNLKTLEMPPSKRFATVVARPSGRLTGAYLTSLTLRPNSSLRSELRICSKR